MEEQIKKNLERAVNTLAEKIGSDITTNDALKYTQAALNAAHVISVMSNINK